MEDFEDLPICNTCGTQYSIPYSNHPATCRMCLVRRTTPLPIPFLPPKPHHPQTKPSPGSPPIRPALRPLIHHPPSPPRLAQKHHHSRPHQQKRLGHLLPPPN